MKQLIFSLLFICAVSVFAEELPTQISHDELKPLHTLNKPDWNVQGELQTISLSPNAAFGPAMFFATSEKNMMGFRLAAPLSRSEEFSNYSFQLAWRHHFQPVRTSLFFETTLGTNFFLKESSGEYTNSFSAGANFGISHYFNSEFGIGGYGGLDITNAQVTKTFVSTNTTTQFIYPKIALFGTVAF